MEPDAKQNLHWAFVCTLLAISAAIAGYVMGLTIEPKLTRYFPTFGLRHCELAAVDGLPKGLDLDQLEDRLPEHVIVRYRCDEPS